MIWTWLLQSHVSALSISNHMLSISCCLKSLEYAHLISCSPEYPWPPVLSNSPGCPSPVCFFPPQIMLTYPLRLSSTFIPSKKPCQTPISAISGLDASWQFSYHYGKSSEFIPLASNHPFIQSSSFTIYFFGIRRASA